jgi:uncharacterized membrane protein YccC
MGAASLCSYLLVAKVLTHLHVVSAADDQIGGLWAVISTIFVCRFSSSQSVKAAITRVSATSVSFLLCLIYLAFLPFHSWALALLVGASALAVILIGRPDDTITAAVSSAVVMVSAALSPHQPWLLPILRFTDTLVGIAFGLGAVWLGMQLARRLKAS